MTNQEISNQLTAIQTYLETKIPHLATKEDVNSAIDRHVELQHSKPFLSGKQIAAIVSAGVALAGALTAFLAGLVS